MPQKLWVILGIDDLHLIKFVLHAKRIKYFNDVDSIWISIVKAKYGHLDPENLSMHGKHSWT